MKKTRVRNQLMKRKAQIVATLPDHVVHEIVKYSESMSLTKSEYLSLIAKKWFADGCPPINPEEGALREFLTKSGVYEPQGPKIRTKLDKNDKKRWGVE